ncbi:TRAP-type C4-dicarboxylate transport system, large permease component [Halarchaeum acidiphilum MH1-52-1]|uniref:TRAP-type C4-dicarboxylate transport system, large permease component n=1 Tax=Halarchaeum acidiphilum MH1-52-1 TaxID=1261545 RepID=U3ACK7_9EURY|nr:TRAP transporter large permease [Halarchaeum acidiphilum]GAD52508.1 TRAP-type C4-dicarboxylate transport system, large permease component [Halarchaeum acidiphilum MH1-52-1]
MADLLVVGLLFLGTLLVLYAIGVPIAVAMGFTSVIVMLSPYGGGAINYEVVSKQLLYGANSFTLLAVPFYLLLGRLMNRMGMTQRIFRLANALVGQFKGGIAHVNIVASMLFSGMSGIAIADASGLGRIEYAAMREQGYDKDISLGVTGASSIIGPIIPPSVPAIIYALLAGVSVGDLFLAGIVPGILLGLFLMATVVIIVHRRGYEPGNEFELDELWASLKGALTAILTPVIVVGGIISGVFSATEAGAIAIIYVLLIGVFQYGELTVAGIVDELRNGMVETFSLVFIVAAASLYGYVALQLRLPFLLTDAITSVTTNPVLIVCLLVVLLLIVGTFMETVAAISILVPVFMPILNTTGIDPTYFGIVMILTLMLGLLTPPFGVILFVLEKVTDATLEEVMRAIVPYYVPIILLLLLIMLQPKIALFVPSLG